MGLKISGVFRHKILRGQFGPNFGPVAAGRKSALFLPRAAAVGLFSIFLIIENSWNNAVKVTPGFFKEQTEFGSFPFRANSHNFAS